MLSRLPPDQVVQQAHGDTFTYLYADPVVCHCLYTGTPQNFDRFQQERLQARIASEQVAAAQLYNDSAWNWDAWGPW